jgi:uncharacterized protein YdeI (BOF family)
MRLASTVLTAAVLVAASCSADARATGTTTTTTTAATTTTLPVKSAVPINTSTAAVQCVHTDPGKMPISVHRALSCPDGTEVAVWGIVTRGADGSTMLCDDATGTACLKIDAGAAIDSPGSLGGKVFFTGIVSKGVLTTPRSPVLEHP